MKKTMQVITCVTILCASISASANTWYVATNSASDGPGTAWDNAYHTIQGAVDAAVSNDTVLVTNGMYNIGGRTVGGYALPNRLVITNSVTVKSVNGVAHTQIAGASDNGTNGSAAVRCIYMTSGSTLSGFTLTNGYTLASGNEDFEQGGGGAFLDHGGIITNCIVTDCEAERYGGGVYGYYGGEIVDSEIKNNQIPTGFGDRQGAGIRLEYGGEVNRCHIHDNLADNWDGGGVYVYYDGLVRNSLIEHNAAWSGGGVYTSGSGDNYHAQQVYNCTVVNNTADFDGGGIRCLNGGEIRNSIVYNNISNGSGKEDNFENGGPDISYEYTCITPSISGTGNITSDPTFADTVSGDYRIMESSPCVDTGSNSFVSGSTDLAGQPRIINGTVDMGAYETPWAIVDITNNNTTVFGSVATYTIGGTNSSITGIMSWTNSLTGSNGTLAAISPWEISDIPLAFGDNTITVYATNDLGGATNDSVVITRILNAGPSSPIHYVSTNGANIYPYTNWNDAATSIQDAIDAAYSNDLVLVTNGVYNTGGAVTPGMALNNRVMISKAITVESVNGPNETFIIGKVAASSVRCAYLVNGSVLSGFTLTDGYTATSGDYYDKTGGGIFMDYGGTVSNCVIRNCTARYSGGGAFTYHGGELIDCRVLYNQAGSDSDGGGLKIDYAGSAVRTIFIGNTAKLGGAVYIYDSGSLNNCLMSSNSATYAGGGVYNYRGNVNNCTICDNSADTKSGGIDTGSGSSCYNNIIYYNTAPDSPNISAGSATFENTCTTPSIGSNCITNAPVFVNRAGSDYHVCQNSPTIDRGTDAHAPLPIDLDGLARIQGAAVDIGAYEYSVGEDPDPSPIHYVWADSPAPHWPYTDWSSASHTIQPAVDAAVNNDMVLVTNGVYDTGGTVPHGQDFTNMVVITKNITVTSVNGSSSTFIVGTADNGTNGPLAARCVWISDGLLSGFTITNGHTQTTGSWGYYQRGGGIYIDGGNVTVSNCIITGCSATINGGGVDMRSGGLVTDCLIENNSTSGSYGGGGVTLYTGALLERCIVRNNRSAGTGGDGGGLYFYDGATGDGGTARNCLIVNNSASGTGGGVYQNYYSDGALIDSCTIAGNSASTAGGYYARNGTNINRNCIIAENTATNGTANDFEVHPEASVTFSSCFTNDPLFIATNNFHLSAVSPCINAGTNQAWMSDTTDLDGAPRILNTIVDIGAYEYFATHYVSTNGTHVFPFASWADAATNIQAAVDAANPGNTILVSNGTYNISNDIDITNDLTIRAISDDPALTVINPDGNDRAFELGDYNIMVAGFTITNGNLGWSEYGGGIYAHSTTPVVSNCVISGCYAGRGGAVWQGTLTHCILTGNESSSMGGGAYQSVISFCEVSNNESDRGGGIAETTANNCIIKNNRVINWGGGTYLGIVNNSEISGNRANYGGGTYDTDINNCSIIHNNANNSGGGTRLGTINNSIVYYNTDAYGYPNRYDGTYNYCCTTADGTNGIGNIDATPQLLSSSHIATNSPCIGAATNAYTSGSDIDNESWRTPPSIGCDEPYAGAHTGTLSVAIVAGRTYTYKNRALTFYADIDGNPSKNIWNFGVGRSATNLYEAICSWDTLGDYTIYLTAFNDDYPAGISTSILISVITNVHYVAADSTTAVSPYSTWATAASNIQDAVDAALDDGTVLVTNGTYILDNRVYIDKNITVKSVNGYENTIVDGNANDRCFYLRDYDILLAGFTVTNGFYDDDGGGIYCSSTKPVISNCVIVGSTSDDEYDGGGVYRGTLYNCTIKNNYSTEDGGGLAGSIAYNCLITGNFSEDDGGGIYYGTLNNCTIVNNHADGNGGGCYYGTLTNCIVWNNTSISTGTNWGYGTMDYSCTTPAPGTGSGNITNNPQFIDATNSNYRLQYGSPCIDTGTNLPSVNSDIEDTLRPLDGNYDGTKTTDMGCYEYNPTTADSNGDSIPDWWYHGYSLDPTDPSNQVENPDNDPFNNLQEYIADTDPTNSSSYFCVTAVTNLPPWTVYFDSSAARNYTLLCCSNLVDNTWTNVPGTDTRTGSGGADSMPDTNQPPRGPFYRLQVELP